MVEIYDLNDNLVFKGNMAGGSKFLNDTTLLYQLRKGSRKHIPSRHNYKIFIDGKEFFKKELKGEYFFLGTVLLVKGKKYQVVEIGKENGNTFIVVRHKSIESLLEFKGTKRIKYNTLYRRIARSLWEWTIFLIKIII